MKSLEELERAYEELGEEIQKLKRSKEKPTKTWPDTFEEAREESNFWGLHVTKLSDKDYNKRYMLVLNGPSGGSCVNYDNTWVDPKEMKHHWSGNGRLGSTITYKFVKFNSAKELYQWLLEGEEND